MKAKLYSRAKKSLQHSKKFHYIQKLVYLAMFIQYIPNSLNLPISEEKKNTRVDLQPHKKREKIVPLRLLSNYTHQTCRKDTDAKDFATNSFASIKKKKNFHCVNDK